MSRGRERGAAILAAMLTVTLVATFAAAAMWQQYRSTAVEAAERGRVEAGWILTGALDWGRLVLREDGRAGARTGGVDHLAEPWAVPLQEARLSTFLAADKSGVAAAAEDAGNAFLSGEIIDLQSRLNVTNLLEQGTISQNERRSFQRLFELLGLPAAQVSVLAENLLAASGSGAAAQGGSQVPLMPQAVEQLTWLGLPAETVAALQPFVTVLPVITPVNLNTAAPEVIAAAIQGMELADAQRLVTERASSHFLNAEDAAKRLPAHAVALRAARVGGSTSYFEVRGRLRLNDTVVEERSTVFRQPNSSNVVTLHRQRGVADAADLPATGLR